MRNPEDPLETQTRRKRANLGWVAQGACLLLLAVGFLAEQAGWVRFESSWLYPTLLAVMGGAWVLEGMIERRLSRQKRAEPSVAPSGGPAGSSGSSSGSGGPPSVS